MNVCPSDTETRDRAILHQQPYFPLCLATHSYMKRKKDYISSQINELKK